jgi:glycosyltransferase involved in cell wall biosynthesis
MTYPFISVIVPCRNEEKFIGTMLENIINQDYNKSSLEVLVIDGISTDTTPEIIQNIAKQHHFIKYFENKAKQVSSALNLGIKLAKGEIIVRMDVHCFYPANYISTLAYYLRKTNADNVGGVIVTVPADDSSKSVAIANVMSSAFGVGNSYFRIGIDTIRNVDTVPFGCFRKEIFSKIGMFDTELVRNQDDEFNGRIIKSGGKVVLVPDLKIIYYARNSILKLFTMFYQYGLFKPLVNIKLGSPATIRQFFPLLFVIYMLSIFPVILLLPKIWSIVYLSILDLYILLNVFFSVKLAIKNSKLPLLLYFPVCFFLIHISYGIGYLLGIVRFVIFKHRIDGKDVLPTR